MLQQLVAYRFCNHHAWLRVESGRNRCGHAGCSEHQHPECGPLERFARAYLYQREQIKERGAVEKRYWEMYEQRMEILQVRDARQNAVYHDSRDATLLHGLDDQVVHAV